MQCFRLRPPRVGPGLGPTLTEPDDGAGGAALDGGAWRHACGCRHQSRQVIDQVQKVRRILYAATASGASCLANVNELVAGLRIAAGHPQRLRRRHDVEQVLRAGAHAITTRGAACFVDKRQAAWRHADRIEAASTFTVTQPQAAPGAGPATLCDHRCRCAAQLALVACNCGREVQVAGAGQARHPAIRLANLHLKQIGDRLLRCRRAHWAARWQRLAGQQSRGEGAASGFAATATVDAWQQVDEPIQSGIFGNGQPSIREQQQPGQQRSQQRQCHAGGEGACQREYANAHAGHAGRANGPADCCAGLKERSTGLATEIVCMAVSASWESMTPVHGAASLAARLAAHAPNGLDHGQVLGAAAVTAAASTSPASRLRPVAPVRRRSRAVRPEQSDSCAPG